MDTQIEGGKVILVLAVTFIIIIGFNVVLFFSAMNKNTTGQINILRRTAGRVRNPWQAEDDELKKLSQMVADLKKEEPAEQKSDDKN